MSLPSLKLSSGFLLHLIQKSSFLKQPGYTGFNILRVQPASLTSPHSAISLLTGFPPPVLPAPLMACSSNDWQLLPSTQMSLFREAYLKNRHPWILCRVTIISCPHGPCHSLPLASQHLGQCLAHRRHLENI